MFDLKKISQSAKNYKNKRLKLFTLGASVATLVASGDDGVETAANHAKPIIYLSNEYMRSGVEFLVNADAEFYQSAPAVAQQKFGDILAIWQTTKYGTNPLDVEVIGNILGADGRPVLADSVLNNQVVRAQEQPEIAILADEKYVVVWSTDDANQDGSNKAVKGQIFSAGGAVGDEFLVNTVSAFDQSEQKIAVLNNGNFVVTWTTSDVGGDEADKDIRAQIFTNAGVKVGDEFGVNTVNNGSQSKPMIAALDFGGFVIVWQSNFDGVSAEFNNADQSGYSIQASIFYNSGLAINDSQNFRVNEEISGSQSDASVATLANGNFVVVYQTVSPDNGIDIHAVIYSSGGVRITDKVVNTKLDGHQTNPNVTALDSGGFLVTWTTDTDAFDVSQTAIKGQKFNQIGNLIGEEFLVNSQYENEQDYAVSLELHDGKLLTLWESHDPLQDGDGAAIKGQMFETVPVFKLESFGKEKFNIVAKLNPEQSGAELNHVTISRIPDKLHFSKGTDFGGGIVTLDGDEITGLVVNADKNLYGQFELKLHVSSLESDLKISSTETFVKISVGTELNGDAEDNSFQNTINTDHVDGGAGRDILFLQGAKADYSFAIVGNDIELTHTASGVVDYLHSVEMLGILGTTDFIVDLQRLGDVENITADEYNLWLNHSYDIG